MTVTPATADGIRAVIAEEARIAPERLTDDATLAGLEIASLDLVSILFAIEDRFGVEVMPEEAAGTATLGDFVALVLAKDPAG